MPDKDSTNSDTKISVPKSERTKSSQSKTRVATSSQIVTADSVQAEEVPTLPLGSLQTISTLQPEVKVHSVTATKAVTIPEPLVVQPVEYRRGLREWLRIWLDGVRPAYVPLALLPALLGSVLAWTESMTPKTPFGHFKVLHFVLVVVAIVLIQLGANLLNDYYDYLRGIDVSNTLGPGKLIQQGLIKPMRILTFGLTLLLLGALLGLVVAFMGNWLVLAFGLVGLLCAYFYSASGRALSSVLLGEIVAFGIFGPLITLGAYIVQTGRLDGMVLLYSVSLGLLSAAVVHMNNMRDVEGDLQAGKRTLASALSLPLRRALYLVLLLGAYGIVVAVGIPHNAPHLVLITLWTLPILVIAVTGAFRTDTPSGLHLVMRETLKMEVWFVCLLIVALIATALWPFLLHLALNV